MKKQVLFSLILVGLFLTACQVVRGSGNVITENREVSNFDQVSLSGIGRVILTQGERERLEIEAEDNIMPELETRVSRGRLIIGTKNNVILNPREPILFYLTMQEITGLAVSGSGDIETERLKTDDLSLDISGSGSIEIDSLTAETLAIDISGSGEATVTGLVEEQTIDISGSGQYHAPDLESETADVQVSGSGAVTIWVNDTLDARVSGSGDIDYYGTPVVDMSVSGSGQITPRDK